MRESIARAIVHVGVNQPCDGELGCELDRGFSVVTHGNVHDLALKGRAVLRHPSDSHHVALAIDLERYEPDGPPSVAGMESTGENAVWSPREIGPKGRDEAVGVRLHVRQFRTPVAICPDTESIASACRRAA